MHFMASSTLSALGFALAQRLIAELWSNLHQVPTRIHERAGSKSSQARARARAHTHTAAQGCPGQSRSHTYMPFLPLPPTVQTSSKINLKRHSSESV
jgi:hypothetical protein